MTLDALDNSHPISVVVKNPDEIAEIFDAISYKKGASIIRMMSFFLSEDTFRQGLTNYLTTLWVEWEFDRVVQKNFYKSFWYNADNSCVKNLA